MEIAVEELSAAAFRPFGEVVEAPADAPEAAGEGWRWWAETTLLPGSDRPYGIGYLALEPTTLRFDWAERHMHSVEMLIPLGGDFLVYVGPPDHTEEPARLPELDRFRVFRVPQGQAVILQRGVWHGAPLALDRPVTSLVLLLQGTGRHDTTLVRFAEIVISLRFSVLRGDREPRSENR